ncbi:MAG: recombination protein RecR [Rhodospirillaceae bacterium]|jgi:recombination protein RecR|nr:recombination protein RecR [Rhodospirillaceae bacterium]MBT4772569.1 recombination protein RecR [Rhodospirillaceae bacterium]MBT5357954.1 recombination protein RecR [Rhodospirillaceae bacterium]MBT5768597.1 recombination protein RecR [Rhodospirillaceae bacterium]MBT6308224.1 recombination protein RecR [Rhodospirillaceae bacterium]
MSTPEIERLVDLLAKLPGLGPRSARRAALHLIKRPGQIMQPLADALSGVVAAIRTCTACGNIDSVDPCRICDDIERDRGVICVIEDVADLWALERTASYGGLYHVLGGTLSALDGVGPDDLRIGKLLDRARSEAVIEVILATNATVAGQTTAHYITERLADSNVKISRLAHGVPVGGELDYLDDGTLTAALKSRREV